MVYTRAILLTMGQRNKGKLNWLQHVGGIRCKPVQEELQRAVEGLKHIANMDTCNTLEQAITTALNCLSTLNAWSVSLAD